jgi:ribosomal protein S17E
MSLFDRAYAKLTEKFETTKSKVSSLTDKGSNALSDIVAETTQKAKDVANSASTLTESVTSHAKEIVDNVNVAASAANKAIKDRKNKK